ncbi:MAG: aldehyde ferredoxin oxidoreductase C-terminal domain-containing protein [Elusimicrobia bacterium]|nr:aldehyde ferredoxin oxidoreductase C-terminal domain-containing protein [Elusimicrobiota bacterium]
MGSATQAVSKKIALEIDGRTVEARADSFLLPAIRAAGIVVPTLCDHKDLAPHGVCRLCVVEVEQRGRRKLVTSCNYPVRGELKVHTGTEAVRKHRRLVAEMYLGRWPNVPVVQEAAKLCGVTASRLRSELTDENPKACILCGNCTRACQEFAQEKVLHFAGRGIRRHLTMPFGEVDKTCVGCTSCAYVCPTGALEVIDDLNRPADPKKIRDAGMRISAEMATLDKSQFRIRQLGTANIVDVMDKYDLLPVHNYKFGSHPDALKIGAEVLRKKYFTQGMPDGCWHGCTMACAKTIDNFELRTGPYRGRRVCVDGPEYETAAAAANMGCFDGDFLAEFNFYCDTYGVDTISVGTTAAFVMEAFEAGQINQKHTGGLKLKFGACAEILELLHQMARGEGFGVDVGQGIRWLKAKWVKEYGADARFLHDIGMEAKGLEFSEYVSKESLAQQGGYGLAVKGPQHDEAWLIFMDMVNNQMPTFAAKADALYYFPLWRTWFGLLGLCKLCWNDIVPADNHLEREPAKVPGHVRDYFEFFEGMTGVPMDENKMLEQSARVYNLQRVLCRMLGFGTREHDRIPFRAMGPVTVEEYESRAQRYDAQLKERVGVDPAGKNTAEKLKLLRAYREDQYEQMMDAAYAKRGWTKNGVPKVARLQELGIALPRLVEIVRPGQD